MALGTNRTRNWGKESQIIALEMLLKQKSVAHMVRKRSEAHLVTSGRQRELWVTPSRNGLTLPFIESVAILTNPRRGHWKALSPHDDRVLATGVSERDVVRATIQAVWN